MRLAEYFPLKFKLGIGVITDRQLFIEQVRKEHFSGALKWVLQNKI